MTDPRSVVRSVLVYSLCLPLAIVLGYQLTGLTTHSLQSVVIFGVVLAILSSPILLRWHHPLLILSWHTVMVLPFLTGRPPIRLALTAASLLITWLMYALDRRSRPQNERSITWPLLFLSLVVVVTMQLTGGAGFGALGSQVGGAGRYVALAGAILGYFALSARPIPAEKANLYAGLFLLGGLTLVISSLATVVPPSMYYLFYIFPVESGDLRGPSLTGLGVSRAYGISLACMSAVFYLLARFGLRGLFGSTKPWRALLFLVFLVGVTFGGYRSFLTLLVGTFALQFYLEGLVKVKFMPVWLLLAALMVSLLPFADRLPIQMQRSLSWIPGLGSPQVRADATASTDWRIKIWQRTFAEIPQYLVLGKGYALDLNNLELAQFRRMGAGRGIGERPGAEGEVSELAGDYHSGPLSVIIPFGLAGVAAVIWFWIAAWRLLLHNYRHGPPELKTINTFLLAFFCARIAHFVLVFGAFYAEFYYFTGLVGFSVALNHGLAVVRPAKEQVAEPLPLRARALRPTLSPPAPLRT